MSTAHDHHDNHHADNHARIEKLDDQRIGEGDRYRDHARNEDDLPGLQGAGGAIAIQGYPLSLARTIHQENFSAVSICPLVGL